MSTLTPAPLRRHDTHRERAMRVRAAWRTAGIPALVTAEQARTIAAVHGVTVRPTGERVALAALAVAVTA